MLQHTALVWGGVMAAHSWSDGSTGQYRAVQDSTGQYRAVQGSTGHWPALMVMHNDAG
jgi:hypothetical protein